MAAKVPKTSRTRLLRLISARCDLDCATEAFNLLRGTFTDPLASDLEPLRYHLFVSLVVGYCRPFTESEGIGSLRCEYPDYPDFPDVEMNARHQRMIDIRNKFLGHSSIHGMQAFLLAPGAQNPGTGEIVESHQCAVAKRTFLRREFLEWLAPVIDAQAGRIDADLKATCTEVGRAYLASGEIFELDKRHEDFTWTLPKETERRFS